MYDEVHFLTKRTFASWTTYGLKGKTMAHLRLLFLLLTCLFSVSVSFSAYAKPTHTVLKEDCSTRPGFCERLVQINGHIVSVPVFAQSLGTDMFRIREENSTMTLALCRLKGKWTRARIRPGHIESDRASNAYWNSVCVEEERRYVYLIPGSVLTITSSSEGVVVEPVDTSQAPTEVSVPAGNSPQVPSRSVVAQECTNDHCTRMGTMDANSMFAPLAPIKQSPPETAPRAESSVPSSAASAPNTGSQSVAGVSSASNLVPVSAPAVKPLSATDSGKVLDKSSRYQPSLFSAFLLVVTAIVLLGSMLWIAKTKREMWILRDRNRELDLELSTVKGSLKRANANLSEMETIQRESNGSAFIADRAREAQERNLRDALSRLYARVLGTTCPESMNIGEIVSIVEAEMVRKGDWAILEEGRRRQEATRLEEESARFRMAVQNLRREVFGLPVPDATSTEEAINILSTKIGGARTQFQALVQRSSLREEEASRLRETVQNLHQVVLGIPFPDEVPTEDAVNILSTKIEAIRNWLQVLMRKGSLKEISVTDDEYAIYERCSTSLEASVTLAAGFIRTAETLLAKSREDLAQVGQPADLFVAMRAYIETHRNDLPVIVETGDQVVGLHAFFAFLTNRRFMQVDPNSHQMNPVEFRVSEKPATRRPQQGT